MACHERYMLFFLEGSLILILLIGCVVSKVQQPYTCGAGLSTPGYTYPMGDITLEYGDDLHITCVLHDAKAAEYGKNASSYMFIKWNQVRQPAEIVNSTAIELHINNHPKTKSTDYTCMVNGTFVCHNVVCVGTKPQNVTDFQCIGHNYENLTCTWTAPENYVTTDYSLEYIPSARPARYAFRCPNITYEGDSKRKLACTWSFSTTPQYRHSHEFYKFYLSANNTFGKRDWIFTFDHYPNVIPNAPENLTATAISPHSIKLKWRVPIHMQGFPGGIEHRVMWWNEYAKHWETLPTYKDENIVNKTMEFILKNLPYAHSLYDMRVSMKSLKANGSIESMWSQNSACTVRTKSKLPDRPPETNTGSFEILGQGNSTVYWQNIYDYEENGQNFSYYIEVEGHPEITPKKYAKNHAKFVLSDYTIKNYTFKVWSKNELGLSENYSTVFIPASKYLLRPPSKLIKVDKGNGVYDLEWTMSDDPRVTSYTIFWCPDHKERPYPCDGPLYWKVVPQGVKNETLKLPEYNKNNAPYNYQFAISANGYKTSSGMMWAGCTVIPGGSVKLRQTYVKNVGARHITVVWKLECLKISDVEGFNITYCPSVSPSQKECKNNSLEYSILTGSYIEEYVIQNLKPYTGYKITVKPLLRGTESLPSEPLFNSTFEDRPSRVKNVEVINKTDTSIFIQWEKPALENGYIRHYQVFYNGILWRRLNHVKDKVVYQENIKNLTARTKYNITVEACTIECSRARTYAETEIGQPDVVPKPSANWDNYSLVLKWDKPYPQQLKVDYYEVLIGTNKDGTGDKVNVTEQRYMVESCVKDKFQTVYVKIRAVNIRDGKALEGPWSERADFPCFRSASSETWVIIIIVMSSVAFVILMIYLIKQFWVHIGRMRNVSVKLPDGLAAAVETYQEKEKHIDDTLPADEPLIPKKFPSQPRNPSGESSGCCSGTESVSSSVESAGHLSMSDSGTEQPRSPSLGLVSDIEGKAALRQRPSVKKTDYVTMPEIPQASWNPKPSQAGYSVIGLVAPPKKSEDEHEYMALSNIPAKSSYVQFPTPQTSEKEQTLRPPPSGYVPYMAQEPAAKNTDYVLAGVPTKTSIAPPKVTPFTQKEEASSGYVKAPPMSMEAPKILIPWQQQSPIESVSTGYVVVGDPKPQKGSLDLQKGNKGYVPHNIKFDTSKSLKED